MILLIVIVKMAFVTTALVLMPLAQATHCLYHLTAACLTQQQSRQLRQATPPHFSQTPSMVLLMAKLSMDGQEAVTLLGSAAVSLPVTSQPPRGSSFMLHTSLPPHTSARHSLLTPLQPSEDDESRVMRAVLKHVNSQQRIDDRAHKQDEQQHGVSFAMFLLRCSLVCKAWRKAVDAQVSW